MFFRDSLEDPDMPDLEELLTPGPGRIEVVGACSLVVPEFSLNDGLRPGETVLQQHHFGPGGVINRHLIRISRGRLIVSSNLISSVEAEASVRTGVGVEGSDASDVPLGSTAADRALAGSRSSPSRFGSVFPPSPGPQFGYQWIMAPWSHGDEGAAVLPEVLPEVGHLVPVRASLMPVLTCGGPIRVLRAGSDRASVPVAGDRVTRSGRYMSSPPSSVGAGSSSRSPGFLGVVVASPPIFVGRADGEERSPYGPSRFGSERRVYHLGPEGRRSGPFEDAQSDGRSVLDIVLSGSLRGLDVAELNEWDHDSCQVFVFRAQAGGDYEYIVLITLSLLV